MDITEVDVPAQKVMGITRKGSYKLISQLLPELFHHIMPKGAHVTGPPMFICHETSIEEVKKADAEGTAKVEVVVPVAKGVPGTDEIRFYEIPGGRMVKAVHKGPYEECESTYMKMFAWIGKKGLTISGHIREAYLNDPREVSPEETLTEIYVPVK